MTDNYEHANLMTCMEVVGGNDVADRDIVMMGLNAWIYSKPHGSSSHGGDIYYLSSCATGRIIRLLVADVSGHGESVKQPAEKLQMLMRRYINQIDQKRFVKAMNSALTELSSGGMFATAVVATYFAPTRTLTLTNAGHPPAIYFDAKTATWGFLQEQFVNKLKPTNIPLGILAVSDYETQSKRIDHGDIVFCYTDALTESKNASGEMLGSQGLIDILNQLSVEQHQQIIPKLTEALLNLDVDNLKNDDVTMLVFSPNLLFEHHYQTPNIKKHVEIMTTLISKIFTKDQPMPWPDLHPANIGGAMFSFLNRLWGRKLK